MVQFSWVCFKSRFASGKRAICFDCIIQQNPTMLFAVSFCNKSTDLKPLEIVKEFVISNGSFQFLIHIFLLTMYKGF